MMKKKTKNTTLSKKVQIAQVILTVLSVLAILAGLASLADLTTTPADSRVVETWRMIGYFTFGALFGILVDKPQGYRDLWIVVILNKLALTVAGILYIGKGFAGSAELITFDGAITVALIVASVLAGVWSKPSKK